MEAETECQTVETETEETETTGDDANGELALVAAAIPTPTVETDTQLLGAAIAAAMTAESAVTNSLPSAMSEADAIAASGQASNSSPAHVALHVASDASAATEQIQATNTFAASNQPAPLTTATTASETAPNVNTNQALAANAAEGAKLIDRAVASRASQQRAKSGQSVNAALTNSSAKTNAAADPLARLLESASVPAANTAAAPQTTAAGLRLAEVESTIARERMQAALETSGATITTESSNGDVDAVSPSTSHAPAASAASLAHASAVQQGQAAAITTDALALNASASGPAADLLGTAPSETPVAARIAAKGADLLASQRGGAITMRLEPPALGQLRIQLSISQGSVVADFTAATAQARTVLEAHMGMLRERLESQGLRVERLTVQGPQRAAESAPVASASQPSESRQDGTDARDRSDRGNTRQDAAGGQSRGRRDDDQRSSHTRTDARWKQETTQQFAGVLDGLANGRTAERVRRAS